MYLNHLFFANVPFPVAQTTTTAPPTTYIHNPYKNSTTTRRGEFALFLILIGTQTFSLSLSSPTASGFRHNSVAYNRVTNVVHLFQIHAVTDISHFASPNINCVTPTIRFERR